jgi:hypothetical protein
MKENVVSILYSKDGKQIEAQLSSVKSLNAFVMISSKFGFAGTEIW